MATFDVPTQNATDDIQPTDQMVTFDTRALPNVVMETRDMAQLRAYFAGADTGQDDVGASLQYRLPLGTTTADISASVDIHVASAIRPLPETRASRLELNVQDTGVGSIAFADWSALASLNAPALPAGGLTDDNSVSIDIIGITFRVAKVVNVAGAADPADEYFGFAVSNNGSYTIGVNYIQLALEAFADRNTPNADVPFDRLPIPDPGTGNANKVATATASGGIVWQDTQSAPSAAGSDELHVRSAVPAITGFSLGDIINVNGELYELIASTEAPNVYHGVFESRESGAYFGDDFIDFGVNSPGNIRAHIPKTGLLTPPATLVIELHSVIDRTHTLYDEFGLARASAQDTATTWGYVKDPQDSTRLDGSEVSAGQAFDVSFYTDGSKNVAVPIQGANRFAPDKRDIPSVNPVALQGNTDRWPKLKLPSDINYGAGITRIPGNALATVNPSANLTGGTSNDTNGTTSPLFSPTIDLDDYPHGELHFELDLVFAPGGGNFPNMGLEEGKTNQTADDRRTTITQIVFASRLLAQPVIQATTIGQNPNGISIARVAVYDNLTVQGYYNLFITRDSQNRVGYYWYWDGEAGVSTPTITATLTGTFTPNDLAGGQTVPNNRRTALWASSSIFPLSTFNANQVIPLTWTLGANSGLGLDGANLYLPRLRSAAGNNLNAIGYWVVVLRGGTEVSEEFFPWGINNASWIFAVTRGSSIHAASRIHFNVNNDGNFAASAVNQGAVFSGNVSLNIYGAI